MKNNKLNSIFLPIWIMWLIPQYLAVSAIVNFIIDSLVVLLLFYVFRIAAETGESLKTLYKESIANIWMFGVLADFIAVIPLILIMFQSRLFPVTVVDGIVGNPFDNLGSLIIVLMAITLGGVLIYVFNYHVALKKYIENSEIRMKVSMCLGIITMPWFFLFPSNLIAQ